MLHKLRKTEFVGIALLGFSVREFLFDFHCTEEKFNTIFNRNNILLRNVVPSFSNHWFLFTLQICTASSAGHRMLELQNACRALKQAGILTWFLVFVLPVSSLENSLTCGGEKERHRLPLRALFLWETVTFYLETSCFSLFAWRMCRRRATGKIVPDSTVVPMLQDRGEQGSPSSVGNYSLPNKGNSHFSRKGVK